MTIDGGRPRAVIDRVWAVIDRISIVTANSAAAILVVATVVLALGAFSRYLINRPIANVDQFGGYAIGWVIFLGWGYTALSNRHIQITIVTEHLSEKLQTLLNRISLVVSLLLVAAFTYGFISLTSRQFIGNITSTASVQLPLWLISAVMLIGSLVFCVQILRELFRRPGEARRGVEQSEDDLDIPSI